MSSAIGEVAATASGTMYPSAQSYTNLYTVYMQLSNNMHDIYRLYTNIPVHKCKLITEIKKIHLKVRNLF